MFSMKKQAEITQNSHNFITKFSERLVFTMNVRNISNKELADAVFVAPSTISSYRTGHRVPDLQQLALLSTTLKVTTDYLLGLSDSILLEESSFFTLPEKQS